MSGWPRTSFGRVALATGGVLVLGQVLAVLLFRSLLVEPGARLMGRLIAHEIQLSARLGGFGEGAPGDLLVARRPPRPSTGRPLRYTRILLETVRERLGADTEVRFQGADPQVVWAYMPTPQGPRWLGVVLNPTLGSIDFAVLLWLLGASLVSVAVALLTVRHLDRPLRRLAAAARRFGAGEVTPALPLAGPSEVRTLIETFNRMVADRQRRETEQRLFLAGISHDLRTPLPRLRLALEMLPEEETGLVAGSKGDVDDMEAILDQFMAFARGSGDEPPADTDLAALVRELAAPYGGRVSSLTLDLAPLSPLALRPRAVRRLLTNLLENAVRHGGGEILVRLRERPGGGACLWVLDRGPGIPEAERERVLQPYARLERRTDAAGSGLGLAIVNAICKRQGIGLRLFGREGGGLGVELDFPGGPATTDG